MSQKRIKARLHVEKCALNELLAVLHEEQITIVSPLKIESLKQSVFLMLLVMMPTTKREECRLLFIRIDIHAT